MSGKRRGAILDRDGTLIDFVRDAELGAVVSAFHPAQLRLLRGVLEGLRLLSANGFVLAIATNQPGAAKGQVPREAIGRTNEALVAMLAAEGVAIAKVAVCLHHPEGGPSGDASLVGACSCRKPRPGLVSGLIEELDLDPAATFMIGDSIVDIEAGRGAGVRTALLHDGGGEGGRCESCPLRGAAPGVVLGAGRGGAVAPDIVAARFDLIAAAVVDALR